MFQGTSLLSLDAKGRMTMPSRHREALALSCALEVTVTRHPDGCLLIYPRNRWEKKREAIAALPYSARFLQRIVLGSAVDLTIDKAGRVLIPADLRTLAGLEKKWLSSAWASTLSFGTPSVWQNSRKKRRQRALKRLPATFSFNA